MASVLKKKLTNIDTLYRKSKLIVNGCLLFCKAGESVAYLLLHRSFSVGMWDHFKVVGGIIGPTLNCIETIIKGWKVRFRHSFTNVLWPVIPASICWSIWKYKNHIIFEDGVADFKFVLEQVKIQAFFDEEITKF